jgi:hypothetical protein
MDLMREGHHIIQDQYSGIRGDSMWLSGAST